VLSTNKTNKQIKFTSSVYYYKYNRELDSYANCSTGFHDIKNNMTIGHNKGHDHKVQNKICQFWRKAISIIIIG